MATGKTLYRYCGDIMTVPKNFGFKTIPVEVQSRHMITPPYNFDKHVERAKKDFAEFAKQDKERDK
ncbi:MAG: hypothetical protein JRE23_16200 [Deltaproteobacteria bacterium]|nr:hypothetical protein [Deltaproteobacteria bacterium]